MKNWIKRMGQNKFQFFFFIGILALLIVALILSSTLNLTDDTGDDDDDPTPIDEETPVPEVVKLPFSASMQYKIVRKFYDRNASQAEQELGLIKYGSSYRISTGTSYAKEDGTSFDVLSALSGTVLEVRESPLYGKYVVIEHDNNVKTHYMGLSEVVVTEGAEIKQGDKIGVSVTTDIDQEAGNHVYFKVVRGSKHINPELTIGKKTNEF